MTERNILLTIKISKLVFQGVSVVASRWNIHGEHVAQTVTGKGTGYEGESNKEMKVAAKWWKTRKVNHGRRSLDIVV